MSNRNQSPDNSAYIAALLAALVTALLTTVYFLADRNSTVSGFIQGISGNIIATTLSFLIVYIFISSRDALGNSRNSHRQLNEIDLRIHQMRDEVLSNLNNMSNQIGGEIETKLDLDSNSSFGMKFDAFKADLLAQIQQMGQQIEEEVNEVNTELNLADSNDLYRFYGLTDVKPGMIFQNFRVSRDRDDGNVNAVSFLWADTLFGNTINARVVNEVEPFLRIEFESLESSLGCNVAIRPQNEIAVKHQELNFLFFQARIPKEALEDPALIHSIGIAIRLTNGKYQQWEYASRPGQYIQFPINEDGAWTPVCINLQDKNQWSKFKSDGNPHLKEEEQDKADLSIISAVIVKVGRFLPGIRGELGYGKGKVDIKEIKFSFDQVRI
jgi:hypothetical protein